MNKIFITLVLALASIRIYGQAPSVDRFSDAINHWKTANKGKAYDRYDTQKFRAIADNIVAYQNADGGWPKNLDMTAKLSPDSVRGTLDEKHLRSTLDNANTYSQVEYLAEVYTLTSEAKYRHSAERGIGYMLATQYANGGWRGWDADALTFNDGIMYGVLSTWLDILYAKAPYAWVDTALRAQVEQSWDRGLSAVLKCQYEQHGVKTVWAQQYDHQTLLPMKARSYELPALSAGESADIVMLLMRIRKPAPEIIAAVKAAAAWFEACRISGKRIETISVPEGLAEDPKIKKDRIIVDDPDAEPIWARYYDLTDNTPFFCTRAGVKVATLAEVPAERRVGYAWYGTWGKKVLKKYPEWLRKIER